MRRIAVIVTAAVLALSAHAQQPPSTTTSTERGDENASIRARATSETKAETPRTPQAPRDPVSPRAPGAAPTVAQTTPPRRERPVAQPRSSGQTARQRAAAAGDPDVYLEVPNLSVDAILLDVENLDVHLALDARVANLVSLKAGVDVEIGQVKLEIRGVEAEAYLTVRLDNVAHILDRTLTTIDNNPQLLERLLTTVDHTVGTVGEVANTALQPGGVLSQTVNTLGQTVQRTLDTTGNIVERTLDTTGKLVNERTVGRLLDLPAVGQATRTAAGEVRRVRDASGKIIEYTVDQAGKIVSSRIVEGGSRR
jgi:YD repeat-containing protein